MYGTAGIPLENFESESGDILLVMRIRLPTGTGTYVIMLIRIQMHFRIQGVKISLKEKKVFLSLHIKYYVRFFLFVFSDI